MTTKLKPYPKYKDSGIEWLGDVPGGWLLSRIKDFGDIYNGATPSTSNIEFWGNGAIHWATPVDITKAKCDYLSKTAKKITGIGLNSCGATLLPKGSIIISCRAPIGSIAILAETMCSNQGCKILAVNSNKHNKYLFYSLLSVINIMQVYGSGTTFLEISSGNLGGISIMQPSVSEQTAIATYLDTQTAKIDQTISKAEQAIELLKEKRTALITAVVTGKIDVRECV